MTCSRHILVVDDETDLRNTLKDYLELEGFRVDTAANGREGLERLQEDRDSCLILLDLMMPVMDGWEFLKVLKSHHDHELAKIPVVVVSAAVDVSGVREQFNCEVMPKPISIQSLVALASQYCDRAG